MSIEEFLGRRYKLVKSENFNEYMKAIGIGFLSRKLGSSVRPAMVFLRAGDKYTIKSMSGIFSTTTTFRLNEEKRTRGHDGRPVIRKFTLEGNTLTWLERGHKVVTYIFQFIGDELKMTILVDNVVCTRIFEWMRGMELKGYGSTPHLVSHSKKK